MSNKLIKAEVLKITGLKDRTLDNWERKGNFPKRRHRKNGYIFWVAGEVREWIRKRDEYGIVRGGYLND